MDEIALQGVTPRGFPYPTPDDLVSGGANAIRDLANTIDLHLSQATRRLYTAVQPSTQATVSTYSFWPSAAGFGGIVVPAWATHAIVIYTVNRFYSAGGAGNGLYLRPQLGTAFGGDFQVIGTAPVNFTASATVGDQIAVGAMAGTVQSVNLSGRHDGSAFTVDNLTRITLDLQFVRIGSLVDLVGADGEVIPVDLDP